MIIFLYSDTKYEYQSASCIRSLSHIIDDIKIVYYTIGFDSNIESKNLYKIRYPYKPEYPKYNFYKAELSLITMQMFPGEHYLFTDTDVLFTKRFHPDKVSHTHAYPLASYGPYEHPFAWEIKNDTKIIFDERELMNYLNVPARTQRYVWSSVYSYNMMCKDFFEEYVSICRNQYLLSKAKEYFPFTDETAFNVCLWKRNATQNLGFSFVNTLKADTVKHVEETDQTQFRMGIMEKDEFGTDWEYVDNSKNVLWYHGFKQESEMVNALEYLQNRMHV